MKSSRNLRAAPHSYLNELAVETEEAIFKSKKVSLVPEMMGEDRRGSTSVEIHKISEQSPARSQQRPLLLLLSCFERKVLHILDIQADLQKYPSFVENLLSRNGD